MATRKCGNIYFQKCFMAVRPFLRACINDVSKINSEKIKIKIGL